MPVDRLKKLLETLCSLGLATKASDDEGSRYGITERGLEFLDTYRRMNGFLAVFGDER